MGECLLPESRGMSIPHPVCHFDVCINVDQSNQYMQWCAMVLTFRNKLIRYAAW